MIIKKFSFKLNIQDELKYKLMRCKVFIIVSMCAGTYSIADCVCQRNHTTANLASQAVSRNKPGDRTSDWDREHSTRHAHKKQAATKIQHVSRLGTRQHYCTLRKWNTTVMKFDEYALYVLIHVTFI